MNFKLMVWRQKNATSKGAFKSYRVTNIAGDMSFLEMFDVLNENLIAKGEEPIAFDNDCREGICGTCSMFINGRAHGPLRSTTCCQLYMRYFTDGETITVEPWRAGAFPVIKDLVVDRSAFDRIIEAGGYISVNTGTAPEANSTPVDKEDADRAFAAATCIGCGACVAACPNTSAMLFTSSKITHLSLLPQGAQEKDSRVVSMIDQMGAEGFGSCTFIGECEVACPKDIPITMISKAYKDYLKAMFPSDKSR